MGNLHWGTLIIGFILGAFLGSKVFRVIGIGSSSS